MSESNSSFHRHRRACLRSAAWPLAALIGLPGVVEAGLVEVVAAAKPSVVGVGTFNATASPRFGFRGTGFAVGDGQRVITNTHVLPPVGENGTMPEIMVLVPRPGETPSLRTARVLANDPTHDLALLQIEGAPLPPMKLAASGSAREGMSIALIGFPIGNALGLTQVTHRGIVAAITAIAMPAPTAQGLNAAAISRLRQGSFDILQLDATAYPGNSGGPVLDAETGQVIGVVNMVLVKGSRESALTNPTGISYAIPVRWVAELVESR